MLGTLERLLSSRVKAAVLHLLFSEEGRELHVRELARQGGLSEGTVRQELARLAEVGVVTARRSGNRTYYRADASHPLHRELRGLVAKTSGLVHVLREALQGTGVRVAFVFGSVAAGTDRAVSDVDLMVVGSISLRQVTQRLSAAAESLGREVNPHVMTEGDLAGKKRRRDHFVTTVLASPRLFVVGDERELEAVG
jgi:DNA-binding transcriptional ArsR family regulator